MEREVGFGIRESQARQVFATVAGLKACADRLGISDELAKRWARELGVEIVPYAAGQSSIASRTTMSWRRS